MINVWIIIEYFSFWIWVNMFIKYNIGYLKFVKKKLRFFRLKIKKKIDYDLLYNLMKVNFV